MSLKPWLQIWKKESPGKFGFRQISGDSTAIYSLGKQIAATNPDCKQLLARHPDQALKGYELDGEEIEALKAIKLDDFEARAATWKNAFHAAE